ncbi:MAG: hypothetical protein M3Q07_17125 [Pseudobdellovibrionaceae bacterium]|nr:hypothetical protein [Pseudobdellovibrionaceae bacterium]
MRSLLLLTLILSVVGCNSFQGLTGKKSSSDASASVVPGTSEDAAKGDDKKDQKSCPVKTEGKDDSDDSVAKEEEKKAEKEKEYSDDDDLGLTDGGTEHESDDCVTKEGEDD